MTADLVVVNGRVFTSGPPREAEAGDGMGHGQDGHATAIAIAGGRIAAVGSDREVLARRGTRAAVIDADGGTIMPGFDDTHLHLRPGSISRDRLDLFGLTTLDAVQAAIAAYGAANPDRPWVAGRGWLYAAFPGGMPTREQLDAVVPDRPASFECFDGHTGWLNSAALAAMGIDAGTPDPPGGRIGRDADGRPTGVMYEEAAELVEAYLPAPEGEALVDMVLAGMRALGAGGITAAQDAWATVDDLALLARVAARHGLTEPGGVGEPALPIRFRAALELPSGVEGAALASELERLEDAVVRFEVPGWLRGGILKGFVDGVVEAHTAYLLEPYPGTTTRGEPRWSAEALRAAVSGAHARGWQVKLHAIGDAAVRQALDAFEALGPGAAGERRHRVEHIETLDPEDLPRFAALGVVASMQPYHATTDRSQMEMWPAKLHPAVAASGWRFRTLLDSGAPMAFGSDWPVVPFDPFLEIHAAVNRQTTDGWPPGGFDAHEALTLPEALAVATWGGAHAEGAEGERGSLAPGRLADLIVLDRDLLAEGPSAILGTRVRATVVGGRIAHKAS